MVNIFLLKLGNTANAHTEFLRHLTQRVWVNEVASIQACNLILAFCPIVSRVGTDIEAALKNIPDTNKPVFLVVLHHTFDREYVVPNTRRFVQRPNITTLDFLFNEDGLLTCTRNEAGIGTLIDVLQSLSEPGWPDVRERDPEWLDTLLSFKCLLLPVIFCLLIWDWMCDLLSNSGPPSRRPALRDRFHNGYGLLLLALVLWLLVISISFKIISLMFASDLA